MKTGNRPRGFTLLELLMVIVIILVIAAVAIPSVSKGIEQARLRSTTGQVAALLQQMRMKAVKNNTWYPSACTPASACTNFFVDDDHSGAQNGSELQVVFPGVITLTNTGAPASPVSGVSYNGMPGFDQRGIPCVPTPAGTPTACGGQPASFVLFLTSSSTFGTQRWMAVTVTSGGRVQTWWYESGTWWLSQ